MQHARYGNTYRMGRSEAGRGTSATSWVTSAAYLHDHDGWPQTNIDSGANMTDQAIFLKKGARVAHVVSATLAPPEETPTQGEDAHAPRECMMVQERQDKLLEKLNLDGLSQWTPRNATIARELLLSYHDAFALEPDELGCMSAIEHEIHLSDEEPFKE